MKKFAVVFGVAAVATFTGCRDQDYVARTGRQVQDESKSIETTPTTPVVQPVTTPVTTSDVKVEEPKATSEVKVVAPAEPETTVYIVQNGDYLAKISKKYNVTIDAIKRLNNLKNDTIRVGQKIKLPGKIDVGVQTAPKTPAPKASAKKGFAPYAGATKEYVVKNGDTLGSIAYGNGLNIRQLKQLNSLSSDALKIGQKLKIPAEKVVKAAPEKKADAESKKTEVKQPEVEPKQVEVKQPEAEVKPTADETKPVDEIKPTEPSVATTSYTVQEGEDLTRLSIDFGVSTSVIREMNNLGENDTIKPGQVLKLPAETQQ